NATLIPPNAALAIVKQSPVVADNPLPLDYGTPLKDQVTYPFQVTNSGVNNAIEVVFTFSNSAGPTGGTPVATGFNRRDVAQNGSSINAKCGPSGDSVRCNVGDVVPGDTTLAIVGAYADADDPAILPLNASGNGSGKETGEVTNAEIPGFTKK